jgi:glycosyltransferase involved in cell wall biosynthesis
VSRIRIAAGYGSAPTGAAGKPADSRWYRAAAVRVAWTGASVGDISSGSVAALAGQLLMALLDRGVEVDIYLTQDPAHVPESFSSHPGLRMIGVPVQWSWNRWYSRNRALALVTSLAARAWTQIRLSLRLAVNHRRRHYDCIFQFSQTELLLMGPLARVLPPIVVQPSTTAAGELKWHRRESAYARQYESLHQHLLVRGFFALRTAVQRVQLRQVRLAVGASDVFARSIASDYRLPPSRTRVVRHPVDLAYYAGVPRSDVQLPIVLLYASRLSARKGLEMVLELSHRLDDLAPDVTIQILGGASMWSDYSAHLADRNPRVAIQLPSRPAGSMRELYAQADIVLAPSHWEPFSLVTAEALAAGVPVVASDQIGAAEGVDPDVCRVFPAGDIDAMERAVRRLIEELKSPGTPQRLAAVSRSEAGRLFSQDVVGDDLVSVLTEASRKL